MTNTTMTWTHKYRLNVNVRAYSRPMLVVGCWNAVHLRIKWSSALHRKSSLYIDLTPEKKKLCYDYPIDSFTLASSAVSRHLLPWVKDREETTKEIRIIPKASVISREGNLKDGGHLRGACLWEQLGYRLIPLNCVQPFTDKGYRQTWPNQPAASNKEDLKVPP